MITRGYGEYSGLICTRGYGKYAEEVLDNVCLRTKQQSIYKMFQENA